MIFYFLLAIVGAAIMVSLRKSPLPPIVDLGIFAAVTVAAYLIFHEEWYWIIAFSITYRLALHDMIVDLFKNRKYGKNGLTGKLNSLSKFNPYVMFMFYLGAAALVSFLYYFISKP